jgi:M6 family metalloprotease-like protein
VKVTKGWKGRAEWGRTAAAAVFAIAVAAVFTTAVAAPVNGDEFRLKQPDGSFVPVKVWGDEFYQDVESLDGYTLIRDADGWICYAELSADGNEYVSTGVRYTGGSRASGARKGLRINKESVRVKQRREREALGYDELVTQGAASARRHRRSRAASPDGIYEESADNVRRVVGLTLLVQFSDETAALTTPQIEDFCNRSGGLGGNSPAGSVKDYFHDVSNGLLEYTNIVTPVITLDNPRNFYDYGTGTVRTQNVRLLITHAINKLSATGFNVSSITTEVSGSRNVIVALNIFYAGVRYNAWSTGLWPHSGTYGAPTGMSAATIGGLSLGRYQITDMGNNASNLTMGTFVHENCHMIMGWDDLYGYQDNIPDVVETYCVMSGNDKDNPQMPNPYFRDLAGWINTIEITSSGVLSHTANSHIAYKYSRNDNESYYIEARKRVGRSEKLGGEGLIIWQTHREGDNMIQIGRAHV